MTRYGILIAALLSLAACEGTISGFGSDVENAGDAIENTTDDLGDGM